MSLQTLRRNRFMTERHDVDFYPANHENQKAWINVNKYDCLEWVSKFSLLAFRLVFLVQKRFHNSEEVLTYL